MKTCNITELLNLSEATLLLFLQKNRGFQSVPKTAVGAANWLAMSGLAEWKNDKINITREGLEYIQDNDL